MCLNLSSLSSLKKTYAALCCVFFWYLLRSLSSCLVRICALLLFHFVRVFVICSSELSFYSLSNKRVSPPFQVTNTHTSNWATAGSFMSLPMCKMRTPKTKCRSEVSASKCTTHCNTCENKQHKASLLTACRGKMQRSRLISRRWKL